MGNPKPKKQLATAKRRGRPRISPKIMKDIAKFDIENKMQRPENRLTQRVLAYDIHEKLLKKYQGRKRALIPKEGTIEKILGKLPKETEKVDGPWSIHSLIEFPITAEALPAVLRLWVMKGEKIGRHLTIREAQWAARLYSVIKDDGRLGIYASLYAREERILDTMMDLPVIADRSLDLSLFEAMTGQEISRKRAKRILGYEEFDPVAFHRMLLGPTYGSSDKFGEIVGIRETLRDIGGEQT